MNILLQGDCREHLPNYRGQIDTIITDPVWPNAPAGMFPDVPDPQQLLAETLALTDARRLVIVLRSDSDPRFLQAVPARYPFFRTQHLTYAMPGYIGRKLGGDEIAYCFGEPLPAAKGRMVIPGQGPIAQPDDRKANGHPCSRPLVHMRWLVKWWSLPGEVVCDPFMGSGTTIIAAHEMNRQYIGMEINPTYFNIAQQRLAMSHATPQLLAEEPHEQPALIEPTRRSRGKKSPTRTDE